MKYTNKLNLPESIVKSCQDDHQPIEGRYSVTELLTADHEIFLNRKYYNDIEIDVADSINVLFGSAVHKILEDNDDEEGVEKEIKMELPYKGFIIVGKFDRRNLSKQLIEDYKTAKTTKVIKQDFDDYKKQGLLYSWLTYKTTGVLIRHIKFYLLLKDWTKLKYVIGGNYPSSPIYVWEYDISDSDYDYIEEWLNDKLTFKNRDKCSDEDRWFTGDKYAVYKKAGDKRAAYIADSEEDAHNYITNQCGGAGEIQVRKGEYTKCKYYCNVCKFCEQYKEVN